MRVEREHSKSARSDYVFQSDWALEGLKGEVFVSNGFTEFLVDVNGKAPKNLADSIRRVSDASVAFVHSWVGGKVSDAEATSQEAFQHLEFIQGELLRHRDSRKKQDSPWHTSPLKMELSRTVGRMASLVTQADEAQFRSLKVGEGSLPSGALSSALSLEVALTKLKHRDVVAVNFAAELPYRHCLYVLTCAGMGQPATVVEVDVPLFCSASRAAAALV